MQSNTLFLQGQYKKEIRKTAVPIVLTTTGTAVGGALRRYLGLLAELLARLGLGFALILRRTEGIAHAEQFRCVGNEAHSEAADDCVAPLRLLRFAEMTLECLRAPELTVMTAHVVLFG
jgi:hypothetical protein